jgi:hypothetical protein
MTIQEFYDELRKVDTGNGIWYLQGEYKCVRLTKSLTGHNDIVKDFCPLTAVAYQKCGEYFQTTGFLLAAQRLEIDIYDARYIAAASDNGAWCGDMSTIRINILEIVLPTKKAVSL